MNEKRGTRMGTRWAHTWEAGWGAAVERCEDELGRRVGKCFYLVAPLDSLLRFEERTIDARLVEV
jgi:hypothetical protein